MLWENIVGALSAIVGPKVINKIDMARVEAAKANLCTFEKALMQTCPHQTSGRYLS
jgi:hypothetical protein